MSATCHLLVNIDTDPDPEDTPRNDDAVMRKYQTMADLTDARTGGRSAWCIQTSPMYRTRFLEAPFVDFWHDRMAGGADMILHPEEDLYDTPETACPNGSWYADEDHMRDVINSAVTVAASQGIKFAAYKGGYHGLTPKIVALVRQAGIGIELTCAPGIDWPNKEADWGDAPLSAYRMSNERPASSAGAGEDGLVEIPFGWDAEPSDTTARHLLNTHYLVNEFSNLDDLKRVWDVIQQRAEAEQADQIVSILCHTYTMDDAVYRDRLSAILDYVGETDGKFVSASDAADMVQ